MVVFGAFVGNELDLFLMPFFMEFLRIDLDRFQSFPDRKFSSSVANEHDVRSVLHDPSGGSDGMKNSFDGGYAPGVVV